MSAGVWGGLTVAGMPLALPLQAVREVVACPPLRPLPCAAPAIAGGLLLRGVTVPVLDLARLLGRPPAEATGGCVVTVLHAGRLLGLRAEQVDGIFHAEAREAGGAVGGTLFGGSLQRSDTGATVDRLDLPALAAWPDLPWIDDPEPLRARAPTVDGDAVGDAPAAVALMLVRCGRLALGVDALSVQATLWSPIVERSPLGRGACRGTIAHDGRRLAAVDLLALCGLGEAPRAGPFQALVIPHPDGGALALLVEQVMDIVTVPPEQIVPLPGAGAAPLRGVLDGQRLRREQVVGSDTRQHDHLVLDLAALLGRDEARQLAAAATGKPGADGRGGVAAAGAGAVITLRLDREIAVPMAQVQEILPYGDRDAMFGEGSALRRIQVLRGRALPVYCLARLGGGLPGPVEASASVLVVECDGRLVGFGVPALRAIEGVQAERRLPLPSAPEARFVTVGRPGDGEPRSLQLMDLMTLARGLGSAP